MPCARGIDLASGRTPQVAIIDQEMVDIHKMTPSVPARIARAEESVGWHALCKGGCRALQRHPQV